MVKYQYFVGIPSTRPFNYYSMDTLVPEALCEAKETRSEKEQPLVHIGCESHFHA
jgi:hypothetical protein